MVSSYTSFEAQQRPSGPSCALFPPFFRSLSAPLPPSGTIITLHRDGERVATRHAYVKALLEALCIYGELTRLMVPSATLPLLPPFRGVTPRW